MTGSATLSSSSAGKPLVRPFRSHVTSVIAWCDRTVIVRLRQHPILGAALVSLVFGTGVGLNQGIREGYFLASTLLTVAVLRWRACHGG